MDWQAQLSQRKHLYGGPVCRGVIRKESADFQVDEELDFGAFGEGEHDWLRIRKTNLNTQAAADQLAQIAGVKRSAVSFAGLKDNRAVTTQVFTVWRPGAKPIAYADSLSKDLELLELNKHNKKLRRGAHRANRFCIKVSDIDSSYLDALQTRLRAISEGGVPSYFGAQRFGNQVQNMPKVLDMFEYGAKGIAKPLKSILLSAARSWLFNQIVSRRIEDGRFNTLAANEWLNLDGSSSVFLATDNEQQRFSAFDVHPTAAMWGRGVAAWRDKAPEQIDWEHGVMEPYADIQKGLERFGLEYQRRAIRSKVDGLDWEFSTQDEKSMVCVLNFRLNRGQFATSVLRELFEGIE